MTNPCQSTQLSDSGIATPGSRRLEYNQVGYYSSRIDSNFTFHDIDAPIVNNDDNDDEAYDPDTIVDITGSVYAGRDHSTSSIVPVSVIEHRGVNPWILHIHGLDFKTQCTLYKLRRLGINWHLGQYGSRSYTSYIVPWPGDLMDIWCDAKAKFEDDNEHIYLSSWSDQHIQIRDVVDYDYLHCFDNAAGLHQVCCVIEEK